MKDELKQRIKNQSTTPQRQHTTSPPIPQDKTLGTVYDQLERMIPELSRALPSHLDPHRMARLAFTVFRTTPALWSCDIRSLLGAVMVVGQLGLEPGVLGQCWFVPFKGKVTPIIGYPGYISLAYRSGQLASIVTREVCEGDEWEYAFGIDHDTLHHVASGAIRHRDTLKAVYLLAKFKDGGYYFDVMSREEIEVRRQRSPGSAKADSPWNHPYDYLPMARKTLIRKSWPYLPLSPELRAAVGYDERPAPSLVGGEFLDIVPMDPIDPPTTAIREDSEARDPHLDADHPDTPPPPV